MAIKKKYNNRYRPVLTVVGIMIIVSFAFASGSGRGANLIPAGLVDGITALFGSSTEPEREQYSLKKAPDAVEDFDGDGIPNDLDIDDDNDGILDAVESPGCFFTREEARVLSGIGSDLTLGAADSFTTLYDGINTGQAFNFVTGQAIAPGTTIYALEYPTPVIMNTIELYNANANGFTSANTFVHVYGSTDGINFTKITVTAVNIRNSNPSINITSTEPYRFYQMRHIGTVAAGNSTSVSTTAAVINEVQVNFAANALHIASLHPKPSACGSDQDGDGFPNHQDLDSDGDGCSDAFEAGATSSMAADFQFPVNNVNTYGINPGIYSTATNDVTYTNTYYRHAVSQYSRLCDDLDGDAVSDPLDVDNDNDGIMNHEESNSCFYNIHEATRIVSLASSLNTAAPFINKFNDLPLLYDNNVGTGIRFADNQRYVPGDALFTMQYPVSFVLKDLKMYAEGQLSPNASGAHVRLFGSNDGINYTAISNAVNLPPIPNDNIYVFNNTGSESYQFYQIRYNGTSSGIADNTYKNVPSNVSIFEISVSVATTPIFNPALHPKPFPCSEDIDMDGNPNHRDLDSDADGCSDAYESGAATNSSVSTFTDIDSYGISSSVGYNPSDATVGYTSTYNLYGTNALLNLCLDSDLDGVPDVKDIDDDNDGVLDTGEGSFCGSLGRHIRVGYLNTVNGKLGLPQHLLLDLYNYGSEGTYNKIRGVSLIPMTATEMGSVQAIIGKEIDVMFAGSGVDLGNIKLNEPTNNILRDWSKQTGGVIFAIQNNAVDYGYTLTNNNSNPNRFYSTLGKEVFFNGYWPVIQMSQTGDSQLTISSQLNSFDILMVDSNNRPVLIKDREFNLVVFPDATIFNDNVNNYNLNPTPPAPAPAPTNALKVIANTWAYVFDRFVANKCVSLDTDGNGIPNHLDSDSDGDGCSDAYEAGATNAIANASPNFKFNGTSIAWVDGNGDGLYDGIDSDLNGIPNYRDTYEIALDSTDSKCIDTDGDGIIDEDDLDDDNDGILDIEEGLSCDYSLRDIRVGYVNSSPGNIGLIPNILKQLANFGTNGTYNKFKSVVLVPFANEAAVTEAQLLTQQIDVFYAGSEVNINPNAPGAKLSSATNAVIFKWMKDFDKGGILLQNNAVDYGYELTNQYDNPVGFNSNPSVPYGIIGSKIFTNGYWPVGSFSKTGTAQMTISSSTRNFEISMVDARGKASFIRDKDTKLIIIPDATVMKGVDSGVNGPITTNEQKTAADLWAHTFDTFLEGKCKAIDTDGDGTPDHLDTDADGDGCYDAVEGSGAILVDKLDQDGHINVAAHGGIGTGLDNTGVPNIAIAGPVVGQGLGNSIDSAMKDAECYDLILIEDSYAGKTGIELITGSILDNDRLDGIEPAIGTNIGEAVMAQSGPWPAGITLNVATGEVRVLSSVPSGKYEMNYQVCINGTDPVLCKIQKITIILCAVEITTPLLIGTANFDGLTNAYKIPCNAGTVANLSTITAGNQPAGVALTWHTATPAENSNKVADVSAVPFATRKFYAAFYDSAAECYSNTVVVTIYASICAVDDDYTNTPITSELGGSLPTIFANDTYNGSGFTMPNATIVHGYDNWDQSHATIVANGTITVPTFLPVGDYEYSYFIEDKDPDALPGMNISIATVKFRIVSCKNPGTPGTPNGYTVTGVSNLQGFSNGWPNNVPNGSIAIESKNQGFVITRVSSSDAILLPVEGMLVYDIAASCVKLYDGSFWNCIQEDCN